MAEEACGLCAPPPSDGAEAMAEQACDTSSEESLKCQELEKAGPTAPPEEKKQRRGRRSRCAKRGSHSKCGDGFATYFPKMLKHIHSDLSLSRSTVSVLDSFVKDMLDRIASEASRLARQNNRVTITSREIQTAVRLLLPGEIGKHAVYEATRAVGRSHHRQ
ncbi:Histone H2B type W-T [Sciurus carolinensis]|uniref:Histone H2B type W-T n=1 Tax=Sciurus carolinensis TaxID=30640 RepID=A0AA41NDF4_SCICA|nr:histone H2B-like [Sciurus carolinensis]XP_047391240.1 histone H2B-like [Sciurus carolinensis]XP_047391243.1 histone H2B-like [Sciurus carolinensis]MBZ3887829.1 Histone H2B type W-T [Sciurus carolinensis]